MCLVVVVLLFLAVPWVCLLFLIILTVLNVRRLLLVSHVTHIKHVLFHFAVYLFLRYFLFTVNCNSTLRTGNNFVYSINLICCSALK